MVLKDPKQKITTFSLVCTINGRNPTIGMNRIHKLASKHKIPISWVLNLHNAQIYQPLINQFHSENNDEIIFELGSDEPISHQPGMEKYAKNLADVNDVKVYNNMIWTQVNEIRKLFPWAELDIANLSILNSKFIRALKANNFIGVWGTNWGPKKIDGIDNEGIPFGVFKIGNTHQIPQSGKDSKNLYGVEKSFKDINKGYYSRKTELYSSEGLELQKESIISRDNIQYWFQLIEKYQYNQKFNDIIPLIQHISADELEFTMQNHKARFPREIDDFEIILDKFFSYINEKQDIQFISLEHLLKIFSTKEYPNPALKYMLLDDFVIKNKNFHEIRNEKNFRKKYHREPIFRTIKNLIKKPNRKEHREILPKNGKKFPTLFIYQDETTQLYFEPESSKNIILRPIYQYIYEKERILKIQQYPVISNYVIHEYENRLDLELEIRSFKEMPWGILISIKTNTFHVESEDKAANPMINNNSKSVDNFVFIYLKLKKKINKYIITLDK